MQKEICYLIPDFSFDDGSSGRKTHTTLPHMVNEPDCKTEQNQCNERSSFFVATVPIIIIQIHRTVQLMPIEIKPRTYIWQLKHFETFWFGLTIL